MAERIEADSTTIWKRAYPWDEWTDGSIWKVTQQEDFPHTTAKSFQVRLYGIARMRHMRVHTKVVGDDTVLFQFFKEEEKETA